MKKQLLMLIFTGLVFFVKGQSVQSISPSVPTSPQAESIQKHGEFGVNYYTGVPDISIPLFEINHHGYKLPLSLKYYPQPIKPGYNYDVFGHGWGLSVNSCISRTIKYLPDEMHDFKIDNQVLSKYYEFLKADMFRYNWEHDIFNVTLPNGSSFEFTISGKDDSNNLQYIISDGRSVIIQCFYSPGNITSFIITDENGVKYTFSGGDTPYSGVGEFPSSFVSWQLEQIDLPNVPNDPILFGHGYTIESHGYSYSEAELYVKHAHVQFPCDGVANCDILPDQFTSSTKQGNNNTSYRMNLLSSIQYGNSFINLTYQNNPIAISNYVEDIKIYENDNLIKRIDLSMNKYRLYSPGVSTIDSVAQLSSIKITGSQVTDNAEIYSCAYSGPGSFYSFNGVDHWGNLNLYDVKCDIGRLNMYLEFSSGEYNLPASSATSVLTKSTQDLSPFYKYQLCRNPNWDNRAPASTYDHGILNVIKYPTGGYSEFTFENNRCLTSTAENGDYILDKKNKREIPSGGFRIRKITNYTADNVVSDTKCFRYGALRSGQNAINENTTPQPFSVDHTNIGEAVVDPDILSYASFTSSDDIRSISIKDMLIGVDADGINPFKEFLAGRMILRSWMWQCNFSASNFRRILDGRSPVVYPEVTVYHGDIDTDNPGAKEIIGKSVYKYDVYDGSDIHFEGPQYYGNTLSYEPSRYLHNTLKEKRDYIYTGTGFLLKRKEINNWSSNFNSVIDYIFINPYTTYDGNYPLWMTANDFFEPRYINLGINILQGKTVTTYDGTTNGITTNESYAYNSRNQLNYKSVQNSNNSWIATDWTYPEINSNGSTPDIIQKMVEKNIISPVIESKIIASDDNEVGDKTVSGAKIDYSEFSAGNTVSILPSKSYKLEINATGSTYNLENEVLKYTEKGNPLEFVTKDGVHTCYIWGYNDRYMVVTVVNASYNTSGDIVSGNDVFSKSKINEIAASTGTESDLLSKLNEIRTTLPSALVTTYTYKPLIGVTSVTDSRGVMTNYTYDTFNRLYLVRNDENNIVGCYQYANQNAIDNGQGGYATPAANIVIGASNYPPGVTGQAIVSISGGTGKFTYNWYLKDSLGEIITSSLNSTSKLFSFSSSLQGTLTVQCTVTDNATGLTTANSKTVTCYSLPTASISTDKGNYQLNSTGVVNADVSGGTGNYTYNWHLKKGSTVLDYSTTTSGTFSFTCLQTGTLTLECIVTDNISGEIVYTFTNIACYSHDLDQETNGYLSFQNDYNGVVSYISGYGPDVSYYFAFSPKSQMVLGQSYFVATVPDGLQASPNQSLNYNSNGRLWEITFTSEGKVMVQLRSGFNVQPGEVVDFGGSYNRWLYEIQ